MVTLSVFCRKIHLSIENAMLKNGAGQPILAVFVTRSVFTPEFPQCDMQTVGWGVGGETRPGKRGKTAGKNAGRGKGGGRKAEAVGVAALRPPGWRGGA